MVSCGDIEMKNVFESECVCGYYFVLGRFLVVWDKYNVDWVFILNFGKKEFKINEDKDKK